MYHLKRCTCWYADIRRLKRITYSDALPTKKKSRRWRRRSFECWHLFFSLPLYIFHAFASAFSSTFRLSLHGCLGLLHPRPPTSYHALRGLKTTGRFSRVCARGFVVTLVCFFLPPRLSGAGAFKWKGNNKDLLLKPASEKAKEKKCDYSLAEFLLKAPAAERGAGDKKKKTSVTTKPLAQTRENFPVGGTTRVQAPQPPNLT